MAVALILLFVVVVRVRLLDVPLERDEGEYAYAGQLMLRGIPPYEQVYNMKLPGAYAAYALFLALFGQTARAVRLGLLLVNLGAILLVFRLGRRFSGDVAGVAAAATYALLSMGQAVLGPFAHSSHLVVLAALAGLDRLFAAFDRERRLDYLQGGGLLGLAVVMKQHGAAFLLFGALALLARQGRGPGAGRRLAAAGLPFALGAALPYLLTCAWLAAAGVFGSFWFWTVRYAAAYASEVGLADGMANLGNALRQVMAGGPLLWSAAGAGLGIVLLDRGAGPHRLMLAAFAGFACLAVCPGLYFRAHYFVALLPAIALLVGVALDGLRRALAGAVPQRAAVAAAGLAFAGVFAVSLGPQADYLFRSSPRDIARTSYGANPFPEMREVGRYIADHSTPRERIAVLGSEPELLFYARRLSATGHIYMYGPMGPPPFGSAMQRQMIRDIERNTPEWLVFVATPSSWARQPYSDRTLLSWSKRYAEEHYRPAGLVELLSPDSTAYTWGDSVSVADTRTPNFVMVYRRKPGA